MPRNQLQAVVGQIVDCIGTVTEVCYHDGYHALLFTNLSINQRIFTDHTWVRITGLAITFVLGMKLQFLAKVIRYTKQSNKLVLADFGLHMQTVTREVSKKERIFLYV